MECIEQVRKGTEVDASSLKWSDALVAATAYGDKYIITSPNSTFIPEPPSSRMSVSMKVDGKYGKEDPLHHPQIFCDSPLVCYLSCVPRPSHPIRRPELWLIPDDGDYIPVTPAGVAQLCVLAPARVTAIEEAVEYLFGELVEYEANHEHSQQLRWLIVGARHACERLSHPATRRDLLKQLTCVERHYCMSLAWLFWHDCFSEFSVHPAAVPKDLIGCFTTDGSVAAKLAHVGIPVWYMRQVSTFVKSCRYVINIVDITPAVNIPTAEHKPNDVIYTGTPGLRQLETIYRKGHVYADIEAVPLPEDFGEAECGVRTSSSTSSSQQRSEQISNSPGALRSEKVGTNRVQPYNKQAKPRDGRNKFIQVDHECVPGACALWKIQLMHTSKPSNKSKLPWGYYLPDANLLVSPAKEEIRAKYVVNWLKMRTHWLSMSQDNSRRKQFSGHNWRTYLSYGATAHSSKDNKVLEHLESKSGLTCTELKTIDAVWRDKTITEAEVTVQLCNEVTWELCELNFHLDLTAMDRIIVRREGHEAYDIEVRRNEMLRKTFFNDHVLDAMNPPPDGQYLGSEATANRLHRLEALRRLMQDWPNFPAELQTPLYTYESGEAQNLDMLEESVVFFYLQSFIRHSGRAPVLPRQLPAVSSP